MSNRRQNPDHNDDETHRAQDDEIDLRYFAHQLEQDDEDDTFYDQSDSRVADGWATESKSDSPRWVKGSIAIVSILIVLGLVAGLAGPFLGSPGSSDSPKIEYTPAQVVEVIDMRTIIVNIDGETSTVRYIGVEPLPINSPWYELGALANQQLVADREVLLEADEKEKDDFDRLLRYVYADRQMVNGLLVRNGVALPSEESEGLNRYIADLRSLSEAARLEGLGHWSVSSPEIGRNGNVN